MKELIEEYTNITIIGSKYSNKSTKSSVRITIPRTIIKIISLKFGFNIDEIAYKLAKEGKHYKVKIKLKEVNEDKAIIEIEIPKISPVHQSQNVSVLSS